MTIIIKVFIKRKILSSETVPSTYMYTQTHAHTHTHTHTPTHAHTRTHTHTQPHAHIQYCPVQLHLGNLKTARLTMIIIIKVFIECKTLSTETIPSTYMYIHTRTHTHTHTGTCTVDHTDYTKLYTT